MMFPPLPPSFWKKTLKDRYRHHYLQYLSWCNSSSGLPWLFWHSLLHYLCLKDFLFRFPSYFYSRNYRFA